MSKGKRIGLTLLLIPPLLGAPWGFSRVMIWHRSFDARDAVHVIAMAAGSLYEANPATTTLDIETLILHLHQGSVINLAIDFDGKAVDPFGTAFQIKHVDQGTQSITTAISAGPDRKFETADDISFSHVNRR